MTTDKIFSKTIQIKATPAKVWEALTHNEILKQWMSDTELEIDTDWKAGSDLVIKGKINGHFEYKGKVLRAEPNKILVYNSWSRISRLKDLPENYTLFEFQLNQLEDETSLTFTNSNLIAKASYEHASFYWSTALEMLKKLLENN